jgi:putative DNA primase/helicase
MQYAMSTPTSTLMTKYGSEIPNDIARLKGTRFVTSFEGEEGKRLDEGLIKRITGNDILTARFMRGEWFDFYSTFKIFFATNHKPVIRGTDKAIWDRIKLIPFEVIIPEERQDKELIHKLELELSGILNWAVEGCLLWQLEGLGNPIEIKVATQSYKDEMDNLKPFLDECCIFQPVLKAKSSQLYEVYRKWCEKEGEKPLHQRAFSMRLQERGFEKNRQGSGNFWEGIGIKDDT